MTKDTPQGPSSNTSAQRGSGLGRDTLWKAALVGVALAMSLGFAAWWLTDPAIEGPLAPYTRLGNARGASTLQSDLLASFPPDSSLPPLLARLQQLGLRCEPPGPGPVGGPVSWRCTTRLLGTGRDQTLVEAVLTGEADRIGTLAVRFSPQSAP